MAKIGLLGSIFFFFILAAIAQDARISPFTGRLDLVGLIGITGSLAPSDDDQTIVTDSASGFTWRSIPNCIDSGGNHLNYATATNVFSCGTTSSGGGTHNLLSATHPDTVVGTVARGDLVVGQTATPAWQRLALGATNTFLGSNATDAAWTAPSGGGSVLGTGRALTGGAGIAALGDLSADRTVATASGETDFLASGALICGAATQGRVQVHTTPLQYCDNAATPALQYAAYGDSSGNALTGDTATAFFSAGTLEVSRGGTGAAPGAGDQVLVSDSTNAATWRSIPTCNTVTEKTFYNTATNTWTCEIDAGGGGGASVADAFVTIGHPGDLTAERNLAGTASEIVVTDGGANADVTLSLDATVAQTDVSKTFTSQQTFNTNATLFQGSAATIRTDLENPDNPADDSFADSPEAQITGIRDSLAGAGITREEINWKYFADITAVAGTSTLVFQSRIGAAAFASRMTLTDAGLLGTVDIVDAATGFRIGGAAASNNVLAGNGTNFVSTATSGTGAPVGTGRTVTSGNGLTGGGDLSANRTLDVVASTGLVANADDIAFKFSDTLAGNPAFNAEECVFSTDGAGGGGFLCEGTTANTNEQLHLFAAADGADTTDFIATSAAAVTDAIGAATTNTLTNKTLDCDAGAGNVCTLAEKIWIPAAVCIGATAANNWDDDPAVAEPTAACVAGTNTTKAYADFLDAASSAFQTHIKLPSDWIGAVDAKFVWLTTAITNNVVWQIATICVADAETDDPAFNTASTVTDAAKGTASQLNDATITGVTTTGCAAGELMHVRILRDPANASDTLGATARLVGVELTTRRAQ